MANMRTSPVMMRSASLTTVGDSSTALTRYDEKMRCCYIRARKLHCCQRISAVAKVRPSATWHTYHGCNNRYRMQGNLICLKCRLVIARSSCQYQLIEIHWTQACAFNIGHYIKSTGIGAAPRLKCFIRQFQMRQLLLSSKPCLLQHQEYLSAAP
jgi:hypothetical protein